MLGDTFSIVIRHQVHDKYITNVTVGVSTIKHEYTLLSFERDLIAVPLGYGCSEKADESTVSSPVA